MWTQVRCSAQTGAALVKAIPCRSVDSGRKSTRGKPRAIRNHSATCRALPKQDGSQHPKKAFDLPIIRRMIGLRSHRTLPKTFCEVRLYSCCAGRLPVVDCLPGARRDPNGLSRLAGNTKSPPIQATRYRWRPICSDKTLAAIPARTQPRTPKRRIRSGCPTSHTCGRAKAGSARHGLREPASATRAHLPFGSR